jgi:peptide/nickel transport system permease protein
MVRFAVARTAIAIPLLFLISIIVFTLIHTVPGGPVEMFLSSPNVRPEDIERLRAAYGLDQPLIEQYFRWVTGFLRGEWGYSFVDGRPVLTRLLERVPATLELVGTAILLAIIVAVPLGVTAANTRNGWFDRITAGLSFAGISLPLFWFALILQLVFAVQLGWLPSSGRASFADGSLGDRMAHLVLPASVLAGLHAAAWSRFLRSSMGQALREKFVVAARARGIFKKSVIWRHALRNALLPMFTVVMLDAAIMVSGAVITESVFAWPGLGTLFTESLARRDYSVLMGFLMATSTAIVFLNLSADVAYRYLDPRTR